MVSRAYHDALFMASVAPTGMIFVPCRDGVSHRPDEWIGEKWLADGVKTLGLALARLVHRHKARAWAQRARWHSYAEERRRLECGETPCELRSVWLAPRHAVDRPGVGALEREGGGDKLDGGTYCRFYLLRPLQSASTPDVWTTTAC